MRVSTDQLLEGLRAAGEPTRLRILATLHQNELTVSELCRVLDQSQPRISRHLKLLVDAGLLERRSEGSRAFFRRSLSGAGRSLLEAIDPLIDYDSPAHTNDRERLDLVRAERAERAENFFNALAADWDRVRTLHVADEKIEAAVLKWLPSLADTLLDVGTGTGRMLEICSSRIGQGIGIDISPPMLELARSRLDSIGARNCAVRRGSVYSLDVEQGSIDAAILHHVLHFLDEPARAVGEAARTLCPGGSLLIVDFASHSIEELRDEHGHLRLGYDHDEVVHWCEAAGLSVREITDFKPKKAAGTETLTTTAWEAVAPEDHISTRNRERRKQPVSPRRASA